MPGFRYRMDVQEPPERPADPAVRRANLRRVARLFRPYRARLGAVLALIVFSAALGVVLEDARPYERPGWLVLDDNVLDLLPGETRELAVSWRFGEPGPLLVEGWNVEALGVG